MTGLLAWLAIMPFRVREPAESVCHGDPEIRQGDAEAVPVQVVQELSHRLPSYFTNTCCNGGGENWPGMAGAPAAGPGMPPC